VSLRRVLAQFDRKYQAKPLGITFDFVDLLTQRHRPTAILCHHFRVLSTLFSLLVHYRYFGIFLGTRVSFLVFLLVSCCCDCCHLPLSPTANWRARTMRVLFWPPPVRARILAICVGAFAFLLRARGPWLDRLSWLSRRANTSTSTSRCIHLLQKELRG